MVKQIVKKAGKAVVKKGKTKALTVAERKVLAERDLIENEMNVGKYKDVVAKRKQNKTTPQDYNDRAEAHHIPPNDYIKSLGIKTKDGIAVEMQRARHTLTESFGVKSDLSKSPRDMLASGIKDWKNKYRYDKNKYKESIKAAKEVIKQNKEDHTPIYDKVNK